MPRELMNPFYYPNYSSTKEIKLPPLTANPLEQDNPEFVNYAHFVKAVLSADPIQSNHKDFMVMAIFCGSMGLAFCKPGDKAWTPVNHDWLRSVFFDLIYHEGKFYALAQDGTVVVCDVAERTTTKSAGPPVTRSCCGNSYLVVSAGELFQVRRYCYGESVTQHFNVFKLKRRETGATEWTEVKDLCDRVFFVGNNTSLSISHTDFPGCKPNCIYYTDDDVEEQWCYSDDPEYDGARDLGVVNLETGKFEKHYYPTVPNLKLWLWPSPLWIEPMLMQRHTNRSKRNIVKKVPLLS